MVSTTVASAVNVQVPETLLKKRRSTEATREAKLVAATEARKVSSVLRLSASLGNDFCMRSEGGRAASSPPSMMQRATLSHHTASSQGNAVVN